MQEHVSDKLKMNDLIKQKNKSIKNQILQKKNTRRIQKQEEQQMQERNDEEQREALVFIKLIKYYSCDNTLKIYACVNVIYENAKLLTYSILIENLQHKEFQPNAKIYT